MSTTEILKTAEEKMQKAFEAMCQDFAVMRAGRADPAILDKLQIDYYGTPTPVAQMANISAPEPRLLLIQPWDRSMIKAIEKAINTSDLGINPSNDGAAIRLSIPPLTEERRKELVKNWPPRPWWAHTSPPRWKNRVKPARTRLKRPWINPKSKPTNLLKKLMKPLRKRKKIFFLFDLL